MFLLDTNTLTLLLHGHERVSERVSRASQIVALTVISRIEMLQGRFASVLKAEDGERRGVKADVPAAAFAAAGAKDETRKP